MGRIIPVPQDWSKWTLVKLLTDIHPQGLPTIERGSWVLARKSADADMALVHYSYPKDGYCYDCKIEIWKLVFTGELYDPSRSE